jgi:hypothetical protein
LLFAAALGLTCLASGSVLARGSFTHLSGSVGVSFAAIQPAPTPRSRPPEQPPRNNNFHLLVGRTCFACRFH